MEVFSTELDMHERLNTLSETLSGGQAQRIAVVRALATNPGLIICDEPTSSLDDDLGEAVMAVIQNWAHETGAAVLWVTHNRRQAAYYADNYLVVARGQVFGDDDGRPIDLSQYDAEQRLTWINDTMSALRDVPNLTRDNLTPANVTQEELAHSGQRLKKKRPNMGDWFRLRIFMLRCGYSEVASDGLRARQKGTRLPFALLRGLTAPFLRSLTWVMLLGLIVFYAVNKANNITQNHLARELGKPEVSHFTFTSFGKGQDLFPPVVAGIDKRLSGVTTETGELLNVDLFGRREYRTDVWLPVTADQNPCSEDAVNPFHRRSTRLLVFEDDEPLFGQMTMEKEFSLVDPEKAAELIGPGDGAIGGGLIATPGFFDDLQSGPISEVCVSFSERGVLMSIVSFTENLPGGGTSTFAVGLDEKTFRKIYTENLEFDLPRYNRAALYFDFHQASDIVCSFKDDKDCAENSALYVDQFKLDDGVMEQISGFTKTAQGASNAFVLLGLSFAAAVAISIALAIRAFVEQDRKSIAIMKAFGISYTTVIVMILSQVFLLLAAAFGLFALCLWGEQAVLAPRVVEAFELPPAAMNISWNMVTVSLSLVLVVVISMVMLVLGVWWVRTRYLGETLQST
mmetsp:Transcript_22853/g.38168  ORF Transcript_22853/g.38168 Transcript_22853/m.38168 type:complete len:627 (+) Transcript_22853:5628-7508(+)